MHRLAGLFRSKSNLTSLKQLEREGVRSVNVLDIGRLGALVGEAMETALREALAVGGSAEFAVGGAQVEFMRRLGLGQRLADHGAELEAQQNALASQVGTLTGVLAQSREQLALSRERDHSAATTGLRAQLDLVLGQTLARLEQLATSTPSVAAEIGTLRRTLRAALLELLDEALCAAAPMRVAGAPADANDTKLDLLERRVRKLNAQLLESQELLARTRAGQSELQGAVPSIHRVAQGLRSDATDGQAKRSLLQAIFEHNLELRRTLADQPDPHAAPTGAGSK